MWEVYLGVMLYGVASTPEDAGRVFFEAQAWEENH